MINLPEGVELNNLLLFLRETGVKAASILKQEYSISACVINVHTLRPLDEKLNDLITNFPLVVTVEEHFISGGLGTIISELITANSIKNTILLKIQPIKI